MTMSDDLAPAYRHCKKVTAEHARTFYFASFFLGKEKRSACYTLYAFCRYIDDLVDEQANTGDSVNERGIRRTVERWRAELDGVYAGEGGRSPVMIAWADVLGRYDIPRELPDLLIEGCMSDLRPCVRYETFDQLYDYCYKVASVVGLMTSRIFGYENPEAEARAVDLGIAMQLTNILRDIGEDEQNGRIYLPQRELEEFNLSERTLRERQVTPEFREFMRFQIGRARAYYRSANLGIPMLSRESRMTVRLMSHNYSRILEEIEGNGYDVFSRRASVPFRSKLWSVPGLWYRSLGTEG